MSDWLFKALVSELNPNVDVIGNYVGKESKVLVKCKLCGEEYSSSPHNLTSGSVHRSKKHNNKRIEFPHKQKKRENIVKRLRFIDKTFRYLDVVKYDPIETCLYIKCESCNEVFKIGIFNFGNFYIHCSNCNHLYRTSKVLDKMNGVKRESKPRSDEFTTGLPRDRSCELPCMAGYREKCDFCIINEVPYYTQAEYKEISEKRNQNITLVGRYVSNKTKIEYICKSCGKHGFASHKSLFGGTVTCKYCQGTSGEQAISCWLDNHNIKYEREKTFDGCVYKKKLRFDFYLNELNVCIEYDGKQHFEEIDFFNNRECQSLKSIKKRDKIKNNYCKRNKIKMIRVAYNCDDIWKFLDNEFNVTLTPRDEYLI